MKMFSKKIRNIIIWYVMFVFAAWFFLSLTLLNGFYFLIWYITIIVLALLIAISIIVCELFKALQTMNEK
ncbi:hypothetical protein C4181_12570 [Clostridioides difficile]|nr:hypothetical protein [Clostridioides difficile]